MEKLQLTPLETPSVQVQISLERAEQLARLGLIPASFASTPGTAAAVDSFTINQYYDYLDDYLSACSLNNSANTLDQKRRAFIKFNNFLKEIKAEVVGVEQVRAFLQYVKNAHLYPDGRWGNGKTDNPMWETYRKPASARTVEYYFVYIRGLFGWAAREELLLRDPMRKVIIERPDQSPIVPFSPGHIEALERAARESWTKLRKRNVALILFMYDTGLRASEVCNMKLEHLEFEQRGGGHVTVIGKGNKRRIVPFGQVAKSALRSYISTMAPAAGTKIWITKTGARAGDALKPNGLRQFYEELGKTAKISGVRCSPHTMRHTFAITFLRNGGNLPTLQYLMGHARVEETMKYLHIVDMDAKEQHAKYSPADGLLEG